MENKYLLIDLDDTIIGLLHPMNNNPPFITLLIYQLFKDKYEKIGGNLEEFLRYRKHTIFEPFSLDILPFFNWAFGTNVSEEEYSNWLRKNYNIMSDQKPFRNIIDSLEKVIKKYEVRFVTDRLTFWRPENREDIDKIIQYTQQWFDMYGLDPTLVDWRPKREVISDIFHKISEGGGTLTIVDDDLETINFALKSPQVTAVIVNHAWNSSVGQERYRDTKEHPLIGPSIQKKKELIKEIRRKRETDNRKVYRVTPEQLYKLLLRLYT